jgi:hypothetical protein
VPAYAKPVRRPRASAGGPRDREHKAFEYVTLA